MKPSQAVRAAQAPGHSQAQAPPWLGLASRVALGSVLVLAGTLKAGSPAEEFAVVIESYRIVPQDMALTLAAFLPWAELLAGYSLILGYLTRQAALASGALLAGFIAALLSARLRGIELPHCGCFGAGWHPSPDLTLLMDLGLAALAALSFRSGARRLSLDNWVERVGR